MGLFAAAVALAVLPSPASAAAPDACLSAPTGDVPVTITSGGVSRTFLTYVPAGHRPHRPLLLDLHGSSGNGPGQLDYSRMRATADRYGFLVAAPDGALPLGGGHAWNIPGVPLTDGSYPPPGTPDDVRYLGDVIDAVATRWCTDSHRVYSTGFSGGARMTSLLGCELASKIAAIAPISGVRAGRPGVDGNPDPATCQPSRPVPVFTVHGTDDPTNPYGDGGGPYWVYGVDKALTRWSTLDSCAYGPRTRTISSVLTEISYASCRASVTLLRITGGHHEWPGSPGAVDPGVDVNAVIWRELSRHRNIV